MTQHPGFHVALGLPPRRPRWGLRLALLALALLIGLPLLFLFLLLLLAAVVVIVTVAMVVRIMLVLRRIARRPLMTIHDDGRRNVRVLPRDDNPQI